MPPKMPEQGSDLGLPGRRGRKAAPKIADKIGFFEKKSESSNPLSAPQSRRPSLAQPSEHRGAFPPFFRPEVVHSSTFSEGQRSHPQSADQSRSNASPLPEFEQPSVAPSESMSFRRGSTQGPTPGPASSGGLFGEAEPKTSWGLPTRAADLPWNRQRAASTSQRRPSSPLIDPPPLELTSIDWNKMIRDSKKSISEARSYTQRGRESLGPTSIASKSGDRDANIYQQWPRIPIRGQTIGNGIASARTSKPPPANAAVMPIRPAFFFVMDDQISKNEFSNHFSHLPPRSSWMKDQPNTATADLRMHRWTIPHYVLSLYNLEGGILRQDWLDFDQVRAGLMFQLQDLQDLVWIPESVAMDINNVHLFKQGHHEGMLILNRRYLVIPVYEQHHWALGIYDQHYHSAWFFDSLSQTRQNRGRRFFDRLVPWLEGTKIKLPNQPLEQQIVSTRAQRSGWECGLFTMEHARTFFREQHLHPDVPADDWVESPIYNAHRNPANVEDPEETMISFWLTIIRIEIGDGGALREPEVPTIEMKQMHFISEIPNKVAYETWPQREREQKESFRKRLDDQNDAIREATKEEFENATRKRGIDELSERFSGVDITNESLLQSDIGMDWGNDDGTLWSDHPRSHVSSVQSRRSSHDSVFGQSRAPSNDQNKAPPSTTADQARSKANVERMLKEQLAKQHEPTSKPASRVRPSYDNSTERTQFVPPTHREGWPGWDAVIRDYDLKGAKPVDEAKKIEEQMRARDARAARRGAPPQMRAPGLSPIAQSPKSSEETPPKPPKAPENAPPKPKPDPKSDQSRSQTQGPPPQPEVPRMPARPAPVRRRSRRFLGEDPEEFGLP